MNTLRTIIATALLAGALIAGDAGTASADPQGTEPNDPNTVVDTPTGEERASCSRGHQARIFQTITSPSGVVIEERYWWKTIGPLTAEEDAAMVCQDYRNLRHDFEREWDRRQRAEAKVERLRDRIERLHDIIDRLRDRLRW